MPPRRRHRKPRSQRATINDDFAQAFASPPTPPSKPPPPCRSRRVARDHCEQKGDGNGDDEERGRRHPPRDQGVTVTTNKEDTESPTDNDNAKKPTGVDEEKCATETVRVAGGGGGLSSDEVRAIGKELI